MRKETIRKKFFNFYIKFYEKKINKLLKKNKCNFCFLGHLHIEIKGKNYLVLDSFKKSYFLEDKDFIIISDVHLGKYEYSKDKIEHLKKILKKNKKVILLGDIFDFWYEKEDKIKKDFNEIIELIKEGINRGKIIYIRGNHDWKVNKILNIKAEKYYIYKDKLFTHGHLLDPFYRYFPFVVITFFKLLFEDKLRITGKIDKIFLNFMKDLRSIKKEIKNSTVKYK